MDKIKELTNRIIKFRDERDWKQFHNPKDVALSMVLEAGEVMEHFQWKNKEEVEEYLKQNKDDVAEEIADVLYYVLLMSHDININIYEALDKKLTKNETKYPVEKAKGNHTKYNKYD